MKYNYFTFDDEMTQGYYKEKTLRECKHCNEQFMGSTKRNVVCFDCKMKRNNKRNY